MMMQCRELGLPGVFEITLEKPAFDTDFSATVFDQQELDSLGLGTTFVQENFAFCVERGVLRGLHFQKPPSAQDKLLRVLRGSVFDVAVDIRVGSPTYGKWVGLEVSAQKWNQVFVPKGFAHGFLALEANTEFLYKVSDYYAPQNDRSVHYDDPDIGIDWPIAPDEIILSEKDSSAAMLHEIQTGFIYK